jgi:hypothetical protein
MITEIDPRAVERAIIATRPSLPPVIWRCRNEDTGEVTRISLPAAAGRPEGRAVAVGRTYLA